uniref:WAP domain-containing protein n=1 Tax=Lepeophtheirus salmonis TaxID=72036 RepID=A0A0K2U8G5_LEPSM
MKTSCLSLCFLLLIMFHICLTLNPKCPHCRMRRNRMTIAQPNEGTSREHVRPFAKSLHRRKKRLNPYRRQRITPKEDEEDGYVITAVILDEEDKEVKHKEFGDRNNGGYDVEEDGDYEKSSYLTAKIADKFKNVANHFENWSNNFEPAKTSSIRAQMSEDVECPIVQGTPSCRQYDGQDECAVTNTRDPSCPKGICCFNGCSNVCFSKSILRPRKTYDRVPGGELNRVSSTGGSCPKPKSFQECNIYERSECWSPGVPDIDCPGSAPCCFDGCRNICMGGSKMDDTRPPSSSSGNNFPEFPNFYSFTSSGGSPEKPSLNFNGQPQIHAPKSTIQIYPVSFMPHDSASQGSYDSSPQDLPLPPSSYPIYENDEQEIDEDDSYDIALNEETHEDERNIPPRRVVHRLSDYYENSGPSFTDQEYIDDNDHREPEVLEEDGGIEDDRIKPVKNFIRFNKGSQKPVIYISNTFHIPSGVNVGEDQVPEGIHIEDFDPTRTTTDERLYYLSNQESDRRMHRYNGVLTPTDQKPNYHRRSGLRGYNQCPKIEARPSCSIEQTPRPKKCFRPNQYDLEYCDSNELCCFDGCNYSCIPNPSYCNKQAGLRRISIEQCSTTKEMGGRCSVDGTCSGEPGKACCFDGCRDICVENEAGHRSNNEPNNEFVSELLSSPDLIKSSLENYFLG